MKHQVPGECPICNKKIYITEFKCTSCKSSINGEFELCKFCKLSKDNKEFAEVFIRNRGNIKEIEKELGISYPTVKGKLDGLISSLGYKNQSHNMASEKRKEVLEQLNSGEINSQEAIQLLND